MLTCIDGSSKTKNKDNNYADQDASTVGLLNAIKSFQE